MSSPAITPQGSSPVLFPDGEVHMIPADNMAEATNPKNGGEVAHKLIFPGEDKPRWVPHSQLSPALQAGGKPADPQALFNIAATQRTPSGVVVSPDAGTMTNQSPQQSFMQKIGQMVGNDPQVGVAIGAAKGLGRSLLNAGQMLPHLYAEDMGGPQAIFPTRSQVQQRQQSVREATTPTGTAQNVGYYGETAAELLAPLFKAAMVPGAMKASAGLKFDAVEKAVGAGDVVGAGAATSAASRGAQIAGRGSQAAKPIADFMREVVDPARQSIPWQEARDFYHTSGSPSIAERLQTAGPMKRQLAIFHDSLGQALQDAANNGNAGEQYQAALAQYHKAKLLEKIGMGTAALAAYQLADHIFGGPVTRLIKSGVANLP